MARKQITCAGCGGKAEAEIHGDGFDSEPASFTLRITCSGGCPKVYISMTPAEMHARTGLPTTGWPR